jgi:hypothetical protein
MTVLAWPGPAYMSPAWLGSRPEAGPSTVTALISAGKISKASLCVPEGLGNLFHDDHYSIVHMETPLHDASGVWTTVIFTAKGKRYPIS